jgi:hypothetical protein
LNSLRLVANSRNEFNEIKEISSLAASSEAIISPIIIPPQGIANMTAL